MRDGLEEARGTADAAAAGAGAPVELSVVGADPADPSVLLLEAPDGRRFRLPASSRLRAAVRSAGPVSAPVPALSEPLRPRDIQARIRAGETAADVAADAGVPLEQVQRYEGPVLAERAHIAALARLAVVRGGPGRLTLEEAVRTRLLARGADPGTAGWDAWRRDGGWAVQVAFRAAGRDRSAQWSFVPSNRVLEPLDDEARWLTAPSDDPTGRRLAAVRVYDVEAEDARLEGGHETGAAPTTGQETPLVPGPVFEPSAPRPAPQQAEADSAEPQPAPASRAPSAPAGSAADDEPPSGHLRPRDDEAAHQAGHEAGHEAGEPAGDAWRGELDELDRDLAGAQEGPPAADDLASRTLDLLDALRDRRGRRVPLDMGPDGEPWDDEEDDDLLNALLDLPPGSDPDAVELQEEVDRARARLRMVTPPRGLQLPRPGQDGAGAADEPPAPAGPRAPLGLVPAPPPTEPLQVAPAPAAPVAPEAPREPVRPAGRAADRSSDRDDSGDPGGGTARREPATRRERWRGADTEPHPAAPPAPPAARHDDEDRPTPSRGVPAPDGVEDPEHDGDDPGEQPARRRRSVPSWDEIVFGAPRRD
ncbi:septation protein SepH [Streptomyces sp. NP160]|uniref:septation protein SepH n=1 Tax=Streptomyces sp. NP160 TaxID=2586637 RepID=UPI0015D655B9|nr:septation protein SepH [Streptomyces sp. NP160]